MDVSVHSPVSTFFFSSIPKISSLLHHRKGNPQSDINHLNKGLRRPNKIMEREHKVIVRDMRHECQIDGIARIVMEIVEEHVCPKLFEDMMDYLLGFNDDMQLVIADNLLDAVCYGWERYIGIRHIDAKMKSFYLLIEEEMKEVINPSI